MSTDPVEAVELSRRSPATARPDLDERLRIARARVLDDRTRVLVVGEFKQGKSMLVKGPGRGTVRPSAELAQYQPSTA